MPMAGCFGHGNEHSDNLKGRVFTVISGFRRDVHEICALLRYYAASCGDCLSKFRDNVLDS